MLTTQQHTWTEIGVAVPWTDKNCTPLTDISDFLASSGVRYDNAYMLWVTRDRIEASEEYRELKSRLPQSSDVLQDLSRLFGIIFDCDEAQLPNAVRFHKAGVPEVGTLFVD